MGWLQRGMRGWRYLGETTLFGSLAHFAGVSLQHAPILFTMLLVLRPSIALHSPAAGHWSHTGLQCAEL